MDTPKHPALLRIARDEILVQQKALSLNAVERDGSDANLILAGIAAMAEEVSSQIVDVEEGAFLDSARRGKLARVGFDRYQILPRPAAPAFGQVEFTTTAPNPTAFPIPVNALLQTADGRQFITTQSTNFAAGITGPIVVEVRSTLGGAAQQVAAGTITSIVSRINGAPDDLAVTNQYATAGAADGETDDQYRARCRAVPSTLPRGTRKAIEQAALRVPGVVTAKCIAAVDTLGRPNAMLQLFITDGFTSALIQQGVNPPAYQTQAQNFASFVYSQIQEWVCDGVFVQVRVAKVSLLPIILQLRYVAGTDTALTALIARATMVQYVNTIPPGQNFVYATAIERLRTVPGLVIFGDEILSPAGDVVPAGGGLEVIRTDLSLVQTSAEDAAAAQLNLPASVRPL